MCRVASVVVFAAIATASLAPCPTFAQSNAWGHRGFISVGGLYDPSRRVEETVETQDINQEGTTITATRDVGRHLEVDISAGRRLKGNLGLGVVFAYSKSTREAAVTGAIPHPLYFNQPRPLEGTTTSAREEAALHVQGMWLLPVGRLVQVAAFGGPTWFTLTQQAIRSVSVTEVYPFSTVGLDRVELEKRKGSHLGFNAGVDGFYFFSPHLGVHGIARYTHGSVKLASLLSDVGGFQIGAGVRMRY